jgi:hypothetical protein
MWLAIFGGAPYVAQDIVLHLLDYHGASLTLKDQCGRSAIFYAAGTLITSTLAFIQQRLGSPDFEKAVHERDSSGATPLCFAVLRASVLNVECLLEAGAVPDKKCLEASLSSMYSDQVQLFQQHTRQGDRLFTNALMLSYLYIKPEALKWIQRLLLHCQIYRLSDSISERHRRAASSRYWLHVTNTDVSANPSSPSKRYSLIDREWFCS